MAQDLYSLFGVSAPQTTRTDGATRFVSAKTWEGDTVSIVAEPVRPTLDARDPLVQEYFPRSRLNHVRVMPRLAQSDLACPDNAASGVALRARYYGAGRDDAMILGLVSRGDMRDALMAFALAFTGAMVFLF